MNIKKIDFKSSTASKEFVFSLHETGFAVLINHPISIDLINDVYEDWGKFFSNQSKFNYLYKPEEQSGYFPFKSENAKDSLMKDLKEFFHLFPHTILPSGLRESTVLLRSALNKLGVELLSWLDECSPLVVKNYFSEKLSEMVKDSSGTLLRILHYPPLDFESRKTGAVRAAAHEDINLITLLPAATAPGLQVKGNDGNWYDVLCDLGSIVINSGDMLQEASRGFYKSTTHRVVNPSERDASCSRYSIPFFMHPRKEVILNQNLSAQKYLNQRLEEIGLIKSSNKI